MDERGLEKKPCSFRRVDPLNDSGWDQNLKNVPEATIFHSSAWARVLAGTYGYAPHYYVAESSGGSIGLCLAEVNSWVTGRRAASLPFADECQVLGVGNESKRLEEVFAFAARLSQESGWKSVEFRGVPISCEDAVPSFFGHELDLRAHPEQLFANCDSSVRRAVRKAERSGIKVRIENSEAALREYFRIHCLTRKKHGVPSQPFKFFEQILLHIIKPGLGFIALARLEERVLAGAIFFHFAGKALYKFGASDPAGDSLRPSNLVMWTAIEHFAGECHQTLSFGRTSLHQDGLRRYKLGWGAKESAISYLKIKLSSKGYERQPVEAGRDSNRLFSKLPLPVLKRIGAWAYPHLG